MTTDELTTVPCDSCDGEGYYYRSRLASHRGLCEECDGTGEVEPDD